MEIKGNVFSIEEFSTFDGPGIRTTIFLKGCPLRCQWCHNPEGQSFSNSVLRSPNGCQHCGNCMRMADIVDGKPVLSENSIKACPNRLLRWCAVEYTPDELVSKLLKNVPILNGSGGGVTFSGGEPLSQPEFLLACLSLLEGKTDRAIQTSGFASRGVFESVLSNADRFLYDIKLVNKDAHKHFTGVSNERILDNFHILATSKVPFVVRTPLIPGVTDTEENLQAIADLLNKEGVDYIELLPYNPMAGSKYALAGMTYQPEFDEKVEVNKNTDIFKVAGITAVLV